MEELEPLPVKVAIYREGEEPMTDIHIPHGNGIIISNGRVIRAKIERRGLLGNIVSYFGNLIYTMPNYDNDDLIV